MSNKNYLAGSIGARKISRANGKKVLRNAIKQIGQDSRVSYHESAVHSSTNKFNFLYIKDKHAQFEIHRRADVVRNEIVRHILAPGGHPLLGGDFVTYINILLQLPVLIFFYKKVENKFIYQQHFDYKKFKFSRGSLRLVESNASEPDIILGDLTIVGNASKRLFRVFNTKFYLRCFLLDTRRDDQPFYEVKSSLESTMESQYEYVRVSLQSLLQQESKDLASYSNDFRNSLFASLEKSLEDYVYINPSESRANKTLIANGEKDEFEEIKYFATGNNPTYGNEGLYKELSERLNNAIETAASSAVLLRKNERAYSENKFDKSAPNMFLMLRAYQRQHRRAAVEGEFRGYSYNTRFNISRDQRNKIRSFLEELSRLGREGYKNHCHHTQKNELYGGYENQRGLAWDFGKVSDPVKDVAYRNFAKSLDSWFWKYLAINKKNIEADKLIDIFLSPIGSQSVSMVDSVFYYGASQYRMPFRRNGGLERLKGLEELYNQINAEERRRFSITMLAKITDRKKREEMRADCIRVVLFYYLTRLFSTANVGQEELNTKVHFYPIDVGGVVIGALGKISYDLKEFRKKINNEVLPVTRQTWDEEVMFFSAVVLPIRASLRRQYRDLQIEYILNQFKAYLAQISENISGPIKTPMSQFISYLNNASMTISRVCPYPGQFFRFEPKLTPRVESPLEQVVDLGEVRLVIKQQMEPFIFRRLTRQKMQFVYDASKSLAVRFEEAVRQQLPRKARVTRVK